MTDTTHPLSHPAEFMPYCVVRIVAVRGGQAVSTGTGFFYQEIISGNNAVILLVTNKHVVQGAEQIMFDMHVGTGQEQNASDSGEVERFTFPINDHTVINHPDPSVDLCGLTVAGVVIQMNDMGRMPFFAAVGPSNIPTVEQWAEFSSIETVTMVGFPNGLADEANRLPLIRQGITATALHRDYNARADFMVDMACFPGSSGSPIFVWNQMYTHNRLTNQTMIGQGRFALVGILFQGPLIDNQGQIVMANPGAVRVNTMMHLGQAVKATAIHALVQEATRRAAAA